MATITYSSIASIVGIKKVVQLQESVWSYETITSLAQLVAAVYNGGSVIGAFDGDTLVGFCYGFPGFKNGQIYLVSHMMAIRSEYRDRGIGYELKKAQRLWAIENGFQKIVWTFDPLETRNGFLNLCKLGGIVRTYREAFYGELSGELNQGLPTDRFLVEWELTSDRVQQALSSPTFGLETKKAWQQWNSILQVQTDQLYPIPLSNHVKTVSDNTDGFLLPVPRDIHWIKKHDIELAKQWRFTIRAICQEAFAKGYMLIGLHRTNTPLVYYIVAKEEYGS